MPETRRRIHAGLILASGLFGVSLSVLILGASRGSSTDAGLPGAAAAEFNLKDTAGQPHRLVESFGKPLVLIVAGRQTKNFATPADEINQLRAVFAKDASVQIFGVQTDADAGLLDNTDHLPGVLETQCPGLTVMNDADGRLTRAYRVPESPTAFVIDAKGVIQARVPLDHDGAAVVIAGTVSSLRPTHDGLTDLPMPR